MTIEAMKLALQAGFERLGHTDNDWVCYPEDIERFAKLVEEKEREACAKIADSWNKNVVWENKMLSSNIAKEIRSRGQE